MGNGLQVQMKNLIFGGTDPTSKIAFFKLFIFACDAADIHERDALWLLRYFMKGNVRDYIRVMIGPELRRKSLSQSYSLKTNPKAVSYFLRKYATEDIIADVDASLFTLESGPRKDPVSFSNTVS